MKTALIAFVAMSISGSFASAADKLACQDGEKLIISCHAKLPYDEANYASYYRSAILCKGADQVFFSFTMKAEETTSKPEASEVIGNPGGANNPFPAEYTRIYAVEKGAMGITADHKKALIVGAIGHTMFTSELDCQ